MIRCFLCDDKQIYKVSLMHEIPRLEGYALCDACITRLKQEYACSNCSTWPVPPEWPGIAKRMCTPCRESRELSRILAANYQAKKRGSPHTLTLPQWPYTLNIQFIGHCAYCIEKPYEILEHFIPLKLGGGTTASNCVPACCSCNSLKYSSLPYKVIHKFSPGTIERVHTYLLSVSDITNL